MFTADPYGDGYTVVDDHDGRPLTFRPRSLQSAQATANILNRAAAAGPKTLARALGCVEDDETDFLAVRF